MIDKNKREFYGRVSSSLKQIKKEMHFLENSRKIMRQFPSIKTKMFTIVIIGFPNIGKTTLLYKLTGSKPEISNYAFTTKGMNTAYFKLGDTKIQVIDTPGTLNRFEKMNNIEKIADLALKHCSDLIVYIFDPTDTYDLKDQKKLLLNIKKLDKPLVTYLSKTDLVDNKVVDDFKKKFKTIISLDELKEEIEKKI